MANAEQLPAIAKSLFQAIEDEDEATIASILSQIVTLAHEGGMEEDELIDMLDFKGLQLGEGMRDWVHNTYMLLEHDGGAPN